MDGGRRGAVRDGGRNGGSSREVVTSSQDGAAPKSSPHKRWQSDGGWEGGALQRLGFEADVEAAISDTATRLLEGNGMGGLGGKMSISGRKEEEKERARERKRER